MIPDLSQLLILDSLLREGSLTRTAELLGMSQPTVSRALARLRIHFGDPLFVRTGQRMVATTRALALAAPIAAVLDAARQLEGGPAVFDPLTANRSFGLYMVDGAVVNILPQLLGGLARLDNGASGLQLRCVHIDPGSIEAQLERGHIDLAIGRFPQLVNNIRRRKLWDDEYACVMRPGHPCAGNLDLDGYLTHRHVLIEMEHTSHHNGAVTRKLESLLEPARILCHVPSFTSAAHIALHTDAIATIPLRLAQPLARDLGLVLARLPIELPPLQLALYWHERSHRDPANQWLREFAHATLLASDAKPHAGHAESA
ncbi:LysR family transcriptional regulator [Massilia aurea]|uniref:LysR family transcriptional regulator n=1 Tax=Massilia aurea TaxID=373040 RepID=UPI003461A0CC